MPGWGLPRSAHHAFVHHLHRRRPGGAHRPPGRERGGTEGTNLPQAPAADRQDRPPVQRHVSCASRGTCCSIVTSPVSLTRCAFGRQLTAGQLLDLGVTDGSKLTLVPAVEAGLVVSKPNATSHPAEFVAIASWLPVCFSGSVKYCITRSNEMNDWFIFLPSCPSPFNSPVMES